MAKNWWDYLADTGPLQVKPEYQDSANRGLEDLFNSLPEQQPPAMGMGDSLMARAEMPEQMPLPLPSAPMGMAESLRQRSGDDMMPPPGPPGLASAPESFRKEIQAGEDQQQARPFLDDLFKSDDLKDAQSERDRLLGLITAVQGAGKIGTALAGAGRIQNDDNYLKDLIPMAQLPVQKIKEQRADRGEKIDTARKEFAYASEKDKDDPNSVVSKLYRDTLSELTTGAGIKISIPPKSSASELEKIYPNLVNLVSAKEARDARLEAAKLMADSRKDKDKERKEDKAFSQETKLRNEVNAVDKDLNFSTTKFNYEGLKSRMDSGKWNGVDDIKAIYGFIKALDPGSVVRESETELVLKAESPILRMLNVPKRITSGDIASPAFRQKLLKSYEDLYNDRRKQFEYKIKPKVKAAKAYDLNAENILSEEVPGYAQSNQNQEPSPQGKTPAGTVAIRRKSDGKMKSVPASEAEKYLKDPNFEKVQ